MINFDKNVGGYLRKAMEDESAAHAYVIAGDKSNIFDLLKQCAHAVMCKSGGCGVCEVCKKIAKGEHQDVLTFPVDSSKSRLSVADVNYLVEESYKKPVDNGEKRVFLINAVDSVAGIGSDLWQNKLLKTLEEPQNGVFVFIGVADSEALLPTVRSRCQILKQSKFSVTEIKNALMEKGFDERSAEIAASLSNGNEQTGEKYLLNPNAFGVLETARDMLENMTSTKNSLKYASFICSNREYVNDFLLFATVLLRESVVYRLADELTILPSLNDSVEKICANYTLDAAESAIEAISSTKKSLDGGSNLQLSVDILLNRLMEIKYRCRQ